MKILITGGCGFVGSNLCLFLKQKKYKITSLDNLSRKGSKYNLSLLKKKKIRNLKINIQNYKRISKLPKFDLIIDCCAEAAVEISKNQIDKVIDTNLIGTINILKKVKKDKSKIIFLSSSRINPINDNDEDENGVDIDNIFSVFGIEPEVDNTGEMETNTDSEAETEVDEPVEIEHFELNVQPLYGPDGKIYVVDREHIIYNMSGEVVGERSLVNGEYQNVMNN